MGAFLESIHHKRQQLTQQLYCTIKPGWRPYLRVAVEILLEVVIVVVFLKVYNLVRNQFGSQKCSPAYALGHAEQVIWAEKLFGIFWEQEIQRLFLPFTLWIRFWNIFYGSAHMAVTVFVLGFLFALRPAAYQRQRTVFIIMNTIAILGYASYPLMPPRLVNDCDDQYGGCLKGYSFVDTMEHYGGLWSWRQTKIAKATNHYAAMPSMHAGYSIWCSMSMLEHSPFMIFKVLAVIYPFLTLYCIVVTANHYFMDAIIGATVLWTATKIAPFMPQIGRGSDEGAAAPPVLGPKGDMADDDGSPLLPTSLAAISPAHCHVTASVEIVGNGHAINSSHKNR